MNRRLTRADLCKKPTKNVQQKWVNVEQKWAKYYFYGPNLFDFSPLFWPKNQLMFNIKIIIVQQKGRFGPNIWPMGQSMFNTNWVRKPA
jgi:hypothetical protein